MGEGGTWRGSSRFPAVLGHVFTTSLNATPCFFSCELGRGTAAWQPQVQRNDLYFLERFLVKKKKKKQQTNKKRERERLPFHAAPLMREEALPAVKRQWCRAVPRSCGEPDALKPRWAGQRRPLMGVPFPKLQLPSQSRSFPVLPSCPPPSSPRPSPLGPVDTHSWKLQAAKRFLCWERCW